MENRSSEGYVVKQDVDDTPINSDGSIDYTFTVFERREDAMMFGWDATDLVRVRVTIAEVDE